MFRTASLADVSLLLDWANREGWNPGLDDASAFFATDPEGFFIAEMEGKPVAGISVVRHSPDLAFLGLYLCLPEWRGRGIGLGLWNFALAHAEGRVVGLDGVAAQQDNYRKSGFVSYGATLRLEGPVFSPALGDARRRVGADDERLIQLDRAANGYERRAFLTPWLAGAPSRRTLVLEKNGEAVGFGTVRLCRSGVKIGPLVAPDADTAIRLIADLAHVFATQRVIVDVPEHNQALVGRLVALGFNSSFATARMYRGPAPQGDGALQGVGTLELG